ncbi:uncharacterized protein LOC116196970 isoform X1 [Punica granatum]|uniref:Uncharacterized protein LOC116196970 isoform X1 n=1 Tax=Punica granatum TaxID=22663 RepID=A0A6P8CSM2_PUNGR|nr:uncharacterized protein LOC116196970 isoform X1 [Punica granatum]
MNALSCWDVRKRRFLEFPIQSQDSSGAVREMTLCYPSTSKKLAMTVGFFLAGAGLFGYGFHLCLEEHYSTTSKFTRVHTIPMKCRSQSSFSSGTRGYRSRDG